VIHLPFLREPRPGEVIRGDLRIPEGPPPRSAVVVVHGFKGFKDWSFFPYVCSRLVGAGYAVVSFNFARNGVGEDLSHFGELHRFASNTLSLELDELSAIVDETVSGDLLPRRPRQVGLLGHSRGGGQAVLGAAADHRVDALVTWAAVSHFDRWTDETKAQWRGEGHVVVLNQRTGQQMPLNVTLLEDYEANRDRLDIRAAAGRLQAPWLIVHGGDDLTVRPDEADALARASRGARVALIENAGHTFDVGHPFQGPSPQLEEAVAHTVAHFREHLGT
jgi:dienelactone hydrolase